jgi:hypothetical protein
MTPGAIIAKGGANTITRPAVFGRCMQLNYCELDSECLKSSNDLRILQQISELLRLVLRRVDQVTARHSLLSTHAMSPSSVKVQVSTHFPSAVTQPSPEQIIVDDFGIFFEFRNSFLREKIDAVVQRFLLHRISTSIFRKEAVGKIIPYIVDAIDCASNFPGNGLDGVNDIQLLEQECLVQNMVHKDEGALTPVFDGLKARNPPAEFSASPDGGLGVARLTHPTGWFRVLNVGNEPKQK